MEIHWCVFVNVGNKFKCLRIIAKLSTLTGFIFHYHSVERYWKDDSLFKVNLRSNAHNKSLADILLAVSRVSPKWTVVIHDQELHGSADRESIVIPGIHLIGFDIENE